MSKLFAFVCAALAVSAFAVNPHGVCGEDVEWAYDPDTLTLTMTGTGPMYDYAEDIKTLPWFAFKDEIENVYVGDGVTSIGINSFFFADNLTSVRLPTGLVSIRMDAFNNCPKLASINFPEGLRRIGLTAFSGCAIPYIKLPKTLEYISYNTFGGNLPLTAIDVDPDNPNLTSIDGVLFNKTVPNLLQYPAGKPGDYEIPSFVETVTGNAFWRAHLLTSIVVPPSMTEIPSGMVYGAHSLKHVSLPDTITKIGSYAFEECTSLETFVVPPKVTSFGHSVFYNCTSLKAISYLGSYPPEYDNYMFKFDEALKVICVPESYNSTTFCGKPITCKSSSCGLLNSQCHDWSVEGDTCSFQEKEEIKEWMNNTNNCVEYVCENDYGFIAKSKCENESMQCMVEDKCFKEDEVEGKKWAVYIEFDTSKVVIPDFDQLVKELSQQSKVDEKNMKVVIEYNKNGGVKRVIVYVDDEKQATAIADAVNKLDKGASCEGILCNSIKATAVNLMPESQSLITSVITSSANRMHSVMAMFVAMMLILLSIY